MRKERGLLAVRVDDERRGLLAVRVDDERRGPPP